MGEGMEEWMSGWDSGCVNGWVGDGGRGSSGDGWMYGCVGGWIEKCWVGGWMDV